MTFTIDNQPITLTANKVKHGNQRPVTIEKFLGKLLKNQRRQLRQWAKLQGIDRLPEAELTNNFRDITKESTTQEAIPLKSVRGIIEEWTQTKQKQPNNHIPKLRLHRLQSRKMSA